ncbi:MAG TPA: hypothetical protein VIU11_01570 [Nakamurella sp.]
MTSTTIKLDSATRDRLRAQARAAHRTLGEHLEHLIDAEDRRLRMDELAAAIAATPPDVLADYSTETSEWERAELSDAASA